MGVQSLRGSPDPKIGSKMTQNEVKNDPPKGDLKKDPQNGSKMTSKWVKNDPKMGQK